MNTPRDFLDSAGTLQNHRVFDSFGRLVSETNAAATAEFSFFFSGGYRDPLTALDLRWHRWYDSQVGRWLSEDWIEDDLQNSYRYVGNAVLVTGDSSGFRADLRNALILSDELTVRNDGTIDYAGQNRELKREIALYNLWGEIPPSTPEEQPLDEINRARLLKRFNDVISRVNCSGLFKNTGVIEYLVKARQIASIIGISAPQADDNGLPDGAKYDPTFNQIYFYDPILSTSLSFSIIIHEVTHAIDDFQGWYLSGLLGYARLEKVEGLGYAAAHFFDALEGFLELYEGVQCGGIATNDKFNSRWNAAWGKMSRTQNVEIYFGWRHRKLSQEDMQDFFKKANISFKYGEIKKLFQDWLNIAKPGWTIIDPTSIGSAFE